MGQVYKYFKAIRHNRQGMGLVEVLLAAGLSVAVFSGTHKALMLSVKTSRLVTSELAERELNTAIGRALGDTASCQANLIPRADLPSTIPESPNKGLYGTETTRDSGAGEVLTLDAGTVSLRRGFEIKGDLRIVKMELKQWDKTPADPDKRVFVVWYEKLHFGPAEEGKTCTAGSGATDQDGCFFSRCELKYKLNATKDAVETCQIVPNGGDCQGVSVASGGGGGPPPCYLLDSAEPGKTIVGCGHGETRPTGAKATAIGFEAGKVNTGANNVFIGYQAGSKTTSGTNNVLIGHEVGSKATTGAKNVFIGYQAGSKTTSGTNNVFIGYQAGTKEPLNLDSPNDTATDMDGTKSNQINIGGIVQASQKRITDPADNTKEIQIGVIKVCNAQGKKCREGGPVEIKECPDGSFVQKINADGTVTCAPACSGGRSLMETWMVEENHYDSYGDLLDSMGQAYYFEVGQPPPVTLGRFDSDLGGYSTFRRIDDQTTRQCGCPAGKLKKKVA